jgi:hypothetical protein
LASLARLPAAVETLDEQAARAYAQLQQQPSDLQKYIYLNEIHDRNQVLYFKLLGDHLDELLPVVYDPTVGDAIEQWSSDYRDSRALYLSIDRPEDVTASFESLGPGGDNVDLIVVSDAQEILGIGDWGVNGTDISIGKLAVNAFLPLLRKSESGRIVNVSSVLGSLAANSDPKSEFYDFKIPAYDVSKAALNAWTIQLAYELATLPSSQRRLPGVRPHRPPRRRRAALPGKGTN